MIAFATAEDAISVLHGAAIIGPYTAAPEDVNAHEYTDAARDRVLSELTALRAENARLRSFVDAYDRAEAISDLVYVAELRDARAALDAKEVEP